MKYLNTFFLVLIIACSSCKTDKKEPVPTKEEGVQKTDHQLRSIKRSNDVIKIDAIASESSWENATWYPMDQVWLGQPVDSSDFTGRYKLTWNEEALFVLVEVTDDVLRDVFDNPLERWWDEDCVEIFIDENNSGGDHQYNHNAFAYHIDTKGNVVDVIAENTPKLFNDDMESARITEGNKSIWEFRIPLYSDDYVHGKENKTVPLSLNKKVGFAIAYCDNDTSEGRENFIGSVVVEGLDKDRGWKDAGIFGTIELKK